MNPKLLSFLLLLLSPSLCQEAWYPWYGEGPPRPENAEDYITCDSPVCVEPCPEAAPPRYCPVNMTSCASGCVCMLECRSPAYVCFQTKYCLARRRYLKRTTRNLYRATIAEAVQA